MFGCRWFRSVSCSFPLAYLANLLITATPLGLLLSHCWLQHCWSNSSILNPLHYGSGQTSAPCAGWDASPTRSIFTSRSRSILLTACSHGSPWSSNFSRELHLRL